MAQPSYADVVVRNIRAERARQKLDQADVVERMRKLGFLSWHRQTISRIEQGKRRVFPDELLGLSEVLETGMATLMFPAPGDLRLVSLPGGQLVILPLRHEMPAEPTRSVMWDGNTPVFKPPAGQDDWLPAGRAPRPAVVAAIVVSARGVLIGRRNDRTPPWTFIAGEQEPGEQPADTIIREVKEETGLEIRAGKVIGERDHPDTGRRMAYLAARPAGRSTRIVVGDEAELAEVRWVSLAEADELLPGMFEPVRDYLARELGR